MNRSLISVAAAAAMLCVSLSAHATLGGDVASVTADQAALGATVTFTTNEGYADYALRLANGGVVHEFVNGSGQVFEVTWMTRGSRPNMNQLLGQYFNRFSGQYNGGSPTSRRADRVEGDFEMHSRALHGFFSGTVHLPAAIPVNLSGPLHLPEDHIKFK